jgi:hypothetical protein
MLKAYFDDSGTHKGSPAVVLGGLIGTILQWETFESEWQGTLAKPLPEVGKSPLHNFHLRPCILGYDDFSEYKEVERELTARHFRDVIHNANLISTASVVDGRAWSELVVGPYRDVLGSAISFCFLHCLDRARAFALNHPEGEKIAVMIDRGIECDRLHLIIDAFRNYSDIEEKFCSITFGKVNDHFPLQGADIIATESYWYAEKWLQSGGSAEPRPPFRHFFENMPSEGIMLDRQGILNDLSRRGPDGKIIT